jgi:tRNA uridine 5-carboxymethylaminomethyl modification enzyme
MGVPATLEYHAITTLSWEAREKLTAIQPTSMGQAGRVPGVSPADLQNLAFEILRRRA